MSFGRLSEGENGQFEKIAVGSPLSAFAGFVKLGLGWFSFGALRGFSGDIEIVL
jgi:hypothetical protein